ncbi:MAG: K(+)-transporting ATPase subunit C, partial [Bacteroidales bacterium]
MKTIWKSIKMTVIISLFLGLFYVAVLWVFAQCTTPDKGNVEVVTINGQIVGAANVGQKFTQDIYFWGRPSCAGNGYNGTDSHGSNKGPTDSVYLNEVETRIDTFLMHHPYLQRNEVPAEMITASGSGLDPDITPVCAYVQVKRVAAARGMSENQVQAIVDEHIQKPFLGLFGPYKINVLK